MINSRANFCSSAGQQPDRSWTAARLDLNSTLAALTATIDLAVSGATAPYAAADRNMRLTVEGGFDRETSQGNARIAYDDKLSFTEAWANYTAWGSTTRQQLSAGRTYGNAGGGSSGNNHSFAVGSTATARVVTDVSYKYTLSDVGGVIIGVSSDAPGANMSVGAGNVKGIYFNNHQILSWNGGTTALLATEAADRTYTMTITVDLSYVTVTAASTDGTREYRAKFSRSGFTVNNISVFVSDSRALTGSSVGPLSARMGLPTVVPHTVEETGTRAHWTTLTEGNVRIVFPKTYDSRRPSPVALCFHGAGGTLLTYAIAGSADTNQPKVAQALLDAGYIVVSASAANTVTFGSDAGLAAYAAAYKYLRDNYSVGPLVVYGNSMGGQESLLTLVRDDMPGILAWCGTAPVCNLATTYANAAFTSSIKSAYGIAADGSDYAAKTAGHDPVLLAGSAFRSLPMLFIAASDDTSIPKAQNTDVMVPILTAAGATVTTVTTTGGHGFEHAPTLRRSSRSSTPPLGARVSFCRLSKPTEMPPFSCAEGGGIFASSDYLARKA